MSLIVTDRLGQAITVTDPGLRVLTPAVLSLSGVDSVVAAGPGTGLVEVSYQGLADTLPITVSQVAASILPTRPADTMDLDQRRVAQVQVIDSGGAPISNPVLQVASDDTTLVGVQSTDTLVARYPGEVTIRVRSGSVQSSYSVMVEGVALLADGVRS